MPTYEALPRFTTNLDRLTSEQRHRFRQTVTAFVEDLRTGRQFRPGLRVKRVQRAPGVYELTWSMGTVPAGRATWGYGVPVVPGDLASHRNPRHPHRSLTHCGGARIRTGPFDARRRVLGACPTAPGSGRSRDVVDAEA
ncbi:hypothetical protein BJ996_007379 [Streptomyces phaeogriseichromatogenes]|nr:hypothetical protein [Streptomyces murinus]